jgi:omega-6 fatty acid desaturase (delta-12 desaturase)
MITHTAPAPAMLTHLRPTNGHGFLVFGAAIATTAFAIALSARGGWPGWIAGQILLGVVLVHWFTLLHEAGHRTLFRSRRLNVAAGVAAGYFAMIPYRSWVRVHGRHHKWTGWQDLDPTAEGLVRDDLSWLQKTIVNVCWRFYIPLFSVLYRLENYWNVGRLAQMFPTREDRRAITVNAALQLAIYALLIAVVGPLLVIKVALAGVVISLMLEDLLLLSQHTHVPTQLSEGRRVPPVPAIEQALFTRSLRLPAWVSALLLHFDAHELHHMYPFVPGYHLRRIPYAPPNEVGWLQWLRASKRIRGVTLLFHSRQEAGPQ